MDSFATRSVSRRTFLGGSLAAGGFLLAGCSDTQPAGGTGTGSGEVTNLRVGLPTDIVPSRVLAFTPQNQALRRTLFDYLIEMAPDGSYQPGLATEWEWNADNTLLTLTLRDDVTFHTGRPFGPDDVVFLIQSALVPEAGAQVAQLLKRGGEVKKAGPNQVSVSFEQPFVSYLDAFTALPVVDSETYDAVADGKQIVGTGPFTWKSWTAGKSFEMESNTDYWDGAPSFESLRFNVIKEPQAMLAAMRAGDLDLVERMVPRDAATLKAAGGFWLESPVGHDIYVGTNTAVKPLDDIRVRQAISYAIDRNRIVEQVYQGLAQPSCLPWPDTTSGVTKEQVARYGYDIERGKALIKEAGAAGMEVAVTPSPADPAFDAIREIVQFGLTEIGLSPKTVTYDAAEYPQHIQAGDLPGLFIGQVALTTMGPTTALLTALPFRPNKNTHNFTADEYTQLVNAVVSAGSEEEQAEAHGRLSEYMVDQAFHNTVVQSSSPLVGVDGLSGVEVDITQAMKLAKAKLTA